MWLLLTVVRECHDAIDYSPTFSSDYSIHFTLNYRVVLKKIECTVILQPFAVESRGFHQNAQKRSLSASQCKIYLGLLYPLYTKLVQSYMQTAEQGPQLPCLYLLQ